MVGFYFKIVQKAIGGYKKLCPQNTWKFRKNKIGIIHSVKEGLSRRGWGYSSSFLFSSFLRSPSRRVRMKLVKPNSVRSLSYFSTSFP